MNYDFPADLTLEEVRTVIHEHNERLGSKCFYEFDRGDHVVFRYVVVFDGSFPEPTTDDPALNRAYTILRECRGMVFHKDGRMLSRRYHKFFNINEKSFTQAHAIDWSQPHMILEKLDGSMVTPVLVERGLGWGTKSGFTDTSRPVEAYVERHPHYAEFARFVLGMGATPIFEWCSRRQKIVVDYPQDRLILTAIRDHRTGRYYTVQQMGEIASTFAIPVVGTRPGFASIEQFMEEAYAVEGMEGYVIRFDSGHMVKIKGRWYSLIHDTKENLTREKNVWQMLLDEVVDDVKPFMDPDDLRRVEQFEGAFATAIMDAAISLTLVVRDAQKAGMDKKAFAAEHRAHRDRGLLFAIWDGRDAFETVRDFLKKNYHTQTKIDNVRYLIDGLRWGDFYAQTISDD